MDGGSILRQDSAAAKTAESFWIARLRGARIEPALRSGPAARDLPPAFTSPGTADKINAMAAGDPVGLLLFAIAATRLALRELTGRGEHTVICPVPAAAHGEVALRAPLDPDAAVTAFLESLHEELTTAAARPWHSRAALAARLDAIGASDGAVLSQFAVVWEGDGPGHGLTAPADLVVQAGLHRPGGPIRVTVTAPLHPPRLPAASLARCVAAALDEIAAGPGRAARALDVLGPGQRTDLRAWSGLPLPAAFEPATLTGLLAAAAARRPCHPAVTDPDGSLTHAELQRLAGQAAARLRASHGIGRGDRVALLLPRGRQLVVGLLAVLAAGACAVPLDPDQPPARVARLIGAARVSAILHAGGVPPGAGPGQAGDQDAATPVRLADLLAGPAPGLAPARARPADPAVLFFTSGSTGSPRLVACRHDQLAHKAVSSARLIGIDEQTRCSLLSAITSDATVYQIATVLGAGGTVVSIGSADSMAPHEFWDRLRASGVNAVNCVPAVLAAMLGALPPDAAFPLRHLILGGEAIPPGLLPRTAGRLAIGTFVNLYGPCEATIEAATFACPGSRAASLHSVPIGRPSPGYGVLVLGPDRRLVPAGVTGELYIAGPAVADGYIGDPAATAERFVTVPVDGTGTVLRTGDFGRWLPDGTLEFLGRRDDQVQVNGHRVELAEVESALLSVPGVAEAAVLPEPDNLGGTKLAGWYVGPSVGPAQLRAALRDSLPAHLVPARLDRIEHLPRSAHGKLDRAALVAAARQENGRRWEPADRFEHLVAMAWQRVLGRPPADAAEDLLTSGGQSLAAARLVSELCQLTQGDPVSIRDVFAARTPVALAAALRAAQPDASAAVPQPGPPDPGRAAPGRAAAVPRPADGLAPASNAQRRMWLLDRLDEGEIRSYNMVEAYRLPRPIGEDALRRGLAGLVARHEGLRTVFAERDGQLCQVIGDPAAAGPAGYEFAVRRAGPGGLDRAVAEVAQEEFRHRFDLGAGPLLRAVLVTAASSGQVLIFNVHHLVCDGWSFAVILRDLLALVASGGRADEEAAAYREHAAALSARLAGPAGVADRKFWGRVLAAAPDPPALPADRRRPAVRTSAGGLERIPFGDGLSSQLAEFSRQAAASPFMILVAAARVLLYRITGEPDILLGTVVSGRTAPFAGSVGLFVNTVVLRTPVHPQRSFLDLVAAVREHALDVTEHEQYPFDMLVEQFAPRRDPARNPLFDIFVETVISGTAPLGGGAGPRVEQLDVDPPVSVFDLSFSFGEPDGDGCGAEVWVGYGSDLFDRATAVRIGEQFNTLLASLLTDPGMPVLRAGLLPDDQRRFLIEDCNATLAPYPADRTLLDLVQAQAAAHPDLAAVHDADSTLTFAELHERSGQLAARLEAVARTGPGRLVALIAQRTEWMVIALLAVLRTGSAFVPLDGDQPSPRLAALLASAGPAAVLADGPYLPLAAGLTDAPVLGPAGQAAAGHLAERAGDGGPATHAGGAAAVHGGDGAVGGRPAGPSDLAYVIFTSGSTGEPKGVMIEHRGIVNTVWYRARYYGFGADSCILQVPPIHFDSGVNDVFSALVAGTAVTVATREQLFDPDELAAVIRRRQVTHIMAVPSLYQLLLERHAGALRSVRQVVLVGERLPQALARKHAELLPDTVLYNEYGPTEDSVWTTVHRITDPGADVLIGHPISNKTVDLLDEHDELVPLGVPGQICIGGVGLARGYLGDPALTERKFTAHPQRPGQRMYRTGDLARRTPSGTLQYLGRMDDQVKIRGQRVEPGEVAAVLGDAPGVRQCAVLAQPGPAGDLVLVAYVAGSCDAGQLRKYLAARLPQAMVPAAYVPVPELPVTSNGKLDRSALPRPAWRDERPAGGASTAGGPGRVAVTGAGIAGDALAAQSGRHRRLAAIWERVLGQPVNDLDAGLFDVGAHSLAAARIAREVNAEFGVKAPLHAVFQYQTLREFADYLAELTQHGEGENGPGGTDRTSGANGAGEVAERMAGTGQPAGAIRQESPAAGPARTRVPLSAAQRRLWLASLASPPTAYNLADAVATGRTLDLAALRAALDAVAARQEMMRAAVIGGSPPWLEIWDTLPAGIPVDLIDLASAPGGVPAGQAAAILAARNTEFDLARPPLFRASVLRGGTAGDTLVVVGHHVVYDGASVGYLLSDLFTAYDRLLAGQDPELGRPPAAYSDWIAAERTWLAGEQAERDKDYWRARLADAPQPADLFGGRARARRRTADFGVLRHVLGEPEYAALRRVTARRKATPFMALCAALAVIAHARTGADDLVLGFPATPPDHPPVVGVFNNPVPLRLDLAGAADHAAVLERVAERVLKAYEHARLPFDIVAEQARTPGASGRGTLFDIGVSWEPAASPAPGVTVPFDPVVPDVRAYCDLWLFARENGRALIIELAYDQALADRAEAAGLLDQIIASLRLTGTAAPLPVADRRPAPDGTVLRGERRYDL